MCAPEEAPYQSPSPWPLVSHVGRLGNFYMTRGIPQLSAKTRRNSGLGARHMVRVFRKGRRIV